MVENKKTTFEKWSGVEQILQPRPHIPYDIQHPDHTVGTFIVFGCIACSRPFHQQMSDMIIIYKIIWGKRIVSTDLLSIR